MFIAPRIIYSVEIVLEFVDPSGHIILYYCLVSR